MRKIVFQVIQYKPFQILVESLARESVSSLASLSVFHFRIRTSFQVPGFEWVHELLLLCLTSNSAQFCAEIACGKTGLGHNCTDSRFRMKNDFSVCRRGALESSSRSQTEEDSTVPASYNRSLGELSQQALNTHSDQNGRRSRSKPGDCGTEVTSSLN